MSPGQEWQRAILHCPVLVFEQEFALKDAVGSHAGLIEALPCVRSKGMPLECSLPY
jgi:hypothetical protein